MFEVVGTPRRWLWPVLAVLARDGILFPVWQRNVTFSVVNTPEAPAQLSVSANRRFDFAGGARSMLDRISSLDGVLLDHLGASGRLVASFAAHTADGSLRLASTRVGVQLRRQILWLPRVLEPRVTLREWFDAEADCQRVSVVVRHPLLGRLYEYAGSFRYEIRAGTHREPGERAW